MATRISSKSPVIPKSILAKAEKDARRLTTAGISEAIEFEFEKIKRQMIAEFLAHPVSQEINNGPLAKNTSGTLGGYGNLFSFIGFDNGERPIDDVVELLERTVISFSQRGILAATITMPSSKQIFEATPLPSRWAEGRSWTRGIESGISGLGYYLHIYGYGASEAGIQAKEKVKKRPVDPRDKNGGDMTMIPKYKNRPYISSLINRYYAEFSKIRGANLRIKKLK
jgi:hypothetical protein